MDGIDKINKLDARRILCPLPVIRTQDAIKPLHNNDILEVTCTDPGTKHDIPSWCRINGHVIMQIKELTEQAPKEIIFTIRVCKESD